LRRVARSDTLERARFISGKKGTDMRKYLDDPRDVIQLIKDYARACLRYGLEHKPSDATEARELFAEIEARIEYMQAFIAEDKRPNLAVHTVPIESMPVYQGLVDSRYECSHGQDCKLHRNVTGLHNFRPGVHTHPYPYGGVKGAAPALDAQCRSCRKVRPA
jgi:hypothetical protein